MKAGVRPRGTHVWSIPQLEKSGMPAPLAEPPTALTVTPTAHMPWPLTRTIALVILTLRGSCAYTARPAHNEHICCGGPCVPSCGPFPVHHTCTRDPPCATSRIAHDHRSISSTLHALFPAPTSPDARTTSTDPHHHGATISCAKTTCPAHSPHAPCRSASIPCPRRRPPPPVAAPPPPLRGEQVGHPPRGVCHPRYTKSYTKVIHETTRTRK